MIFDTRTFVSALCAAALALVATCSAALADDYHLGIGDTLNVEMLLLESGQVEESKIVRLESQGARIGPDGRATVSLVGGVSAVGLTVDELAVDIRKLATEQLPVRVQPYITVSVASYRPVSVLGDVMEPGTYDYLPGMTLREALARAGGTGAAYLSEISPARIIEAMSGKVQAETELRDAQLTRQRLLAELADAEDYTPVPSASVSDAQIARERALFDLRNQERDVTRNHLKAEVERSEGNRTLLEENLAVLERKIEDSQTEATRRADLRDRGLTVADTMFEMNNYINDLEIRKIQGREELRTAEQDIARARMELASNATDREIELTEELKAIDATIKNLRIKIDQESRLSTGTGMGQTSDGGTLVPDQFTFTVISQRTGEKQANIAPETVLFPGDIVEVTAVAASALGQ